MPIFGNPYFEVAILLYDFKRLSISAVVFIVVLF